MGFADSAFGDIEKATLRIIDMTSFHEMKERGIESPLDPVDYRRPSTENTLKKNETMIPTKRKNTLYDIDGNPDLFSDTRVIAGGTSDDKIKAKVFKVQFNPSELVIRGSAGGYTPQQSFNEGGGKSMAGAVPLNITLQARLIFDRVVPGDAFTGITSTSYSAAAQRGASLINNAVSSSKANADNRENSRKSRQILDTHSVRGEVEALVAAVRRKDTQLVNFVWGDYINYVGLLNNISANYVMFNTNGEPIRAFVDISIRIAEENDEDITYLAENAWYEKYKNAFGKDSSYVKAAQKAGSLLGLG